MTPKKILLTAAIIGITAKLGYDKYKDILKLKNIQVAAGEKPFRFIDVRNGVAMFVIGLTIRNPAPIALDLNKLVVEAWYNKIYLGKVSNDKIVLAADDHSALNLPLEIITNKLLPFAKDFLTKGKIPVEFRVTASVKILGSYFTVPYTYSLDIKDALRDYLKAEKPLLANLL
jgi:LEA14-like dessication related protein